MSANKVLIQTSISVRWGDMDAFEHVNNAAYATYVEEARLCWFATIEGGWQSDQVAPILAAQHINYRIPAQWPEDLVVTLTADRVGNSSVTVDFRIVSRNQPERLYADGDAVLVWVARETGKPIALPENVRRSASH